MWLFLKKLKRESPYDATIPLLALYPDKTVMWRDTRTPLFTAALSGIAQTRRPPTDRRTGTEGAAHTHKGIKPSRDRGQNAHCSNTDGPRDYYTRWSRKKANPTWYHLHVESKIWHRWAYQWTETQTEQSGGQEGGDRGRDTAGVEVSRYKLLYTERRTNRVPLYSPENYVQCLTIRHNGKEY